MASTKISDDAAASLRATSLIPVVTVGSTNVNERTTVGELVSSKFNVKFYGAVGNGVANDATAIDSAVTALQAAGGGTLYFPAGTYIYNGAGIVNNPASGVTQHITIAGDGRGVTNLTFTAVTNTQCILLSNQNGVGSGRNTGSGIRGMSMTFPSTKNGIVIANLENFRIADVFTWSGANALTVSESRSGVVDNCEFSSWMTNGIKIVGESFASNNFTQLIIVGNASATGAGFSFEKAGVAGGGTLILSDIIISRAGTSAYLFTAPSLVNFFLFMTDCIADGTFGDDAFKFVNIGQIFLNDPWSVCGATDKAALLLDNCSDVTIVGGTLYSAIGASAADLSLKNSVVNASVVGTRMTGPTLAVRVDGTTHDIILDTSGNLGTTFCNDLTKIVPARHFQSAPYFIGQAALHNVTPVSGHAQVIASGTYEPTMTPVANVAASSSITMQWIRVGAVVSVFGRVDVDPTAGSTLTQLGISLPIASNFTVGQQLAGTATMDPGATDMIAGRVVADATNNRAQLEYYSDAGAANRQIMVSFGYLII